MTTPPTTRPPAPSSQGLHYSFEKAGLTLDRQPIPWNAEAVLVEAIVRAPRISASELADYGLHLAGGPRIPAERSRPGQPGLVHVFFRLAVPARTLPAELRCRDRSLGQINLPLLTRDEFVQGLKIAEPTLHVRHKDGSAHACRAYVTSQAKELLASMMLTSPASLAPLADLELSASLIVDESVVDRRVVRLESTQLAARQALVAVPFPKPKAKVRQCDIRWAVDDEVRATRTIRCCRPAEFLKSLRISTTRIYMEGEGGMLPLARFPPASWAGVRRLGPVFLVSSGIAGMAGRAEFRARALDRRRQVIVEMPPVATLVSDGPTVIAPGTLAWNEAIDTFDLWSGPRRLGDLTVAALATAVFTAEGGIAVGRDDFAWSPEAEELLQNKLERLLGGEERPR